MVDAKNVWQLVSRDGCTRVNSTSCTVCVDKPRHNTHGRWKVQLRPRHHAVWRKAFWVELCTAGRMQLRHLIITRLLGKIS